MPNGGQYEGGGGGAGADNATFRVRCFMMVASANYYIITLYSSIKDKKSTVKLDDETRNNLYPLENRAYLALNSENYNMGGELQSWDCQIARCVALCPPKERR